MSRPVVYVALQQFCEAGSRPTERLAEAGFEVRQNRLGRRVTRAEMPELLRDVDAVIAGVEPYDAALLAELPKLQCISRCGIGTDAIDLAETARRRIAVYITADEVIEPVAQLTVTMIFALARNLPGHILDAHNGLWKKRTGALISEWTIGLIGFGRIGRAVAHYLRPFGPRLLVADPVLASSEMPQGIELVDLPTLLAHSDVVSLHAGRPPADGPLLGPTQFAAMKRGSCVVNTARGYLLDEAALADALNTGQAAGAALDVFAEEPYTGPLARLPQVICTPHIASLTRASRAAMELRCAEHVIDHFALAGAMTRALAEDR